MRWWVSLCLLCWHIFVFIVLPPFVDQCNRVTPSVICKLQLLILYLFTFEQTDLWSASVCSKHMDVQTVGYCEVLHGCNWLIESSRYYLDGKSSRSSVHNILLGCSVNNACSFMNHCVVFGQILKKKSLTGLQTVTIIPILWPVLETTRCTGATCKYAPIYFCF